MGKVCKKSVVCVQIECLVCEGTVCSVYRKSVHCKECVRAMTVWRVLSGECGECAGSLRRVLVVCRGRLDSVECFQVNCEVL